MSITLGAFGERQEVLDNIAALSAALFLVQSPLLPFLWNRFACMRRGMDYGCSKSLVSCWSDVDFGPRGAFGCGVAGYGAGLSQALVLAMN